MNDYGTCQTIGTEISHYEMIIVTNPRSGSRRGEVLLNKHKNRPGHYEYDNGKSCNVEVMDVIT